MCDLGLLSFRMLRKISFLIMLCLGLSACADNHRSFDNLIGVRAEDVTMKFEEKLQLCSDEYSVDPRELTYLKSYQLSENEHGWRECAHDALTDYMIPFTMAPERYEQFIMTDLRMTDRIKKRINSREDRKRELRRQLIEIREVEDRQIRERREKSQALQQDPEAYAEEINDIQLYEKNMQYIHNAVRSFLAS